MEIAQEEEQDLQIQPHRTLMHAPQPLRHFPVVKQVKVMEMENSKIW